MVTSVQQEASEYSLRRYGSVEFNVRDGGDGEIDFLLDLLMSAGPRPSAGRYTIIFGNAGESNAVAECFFSDSEGFAHYTASLPELAGETDIILVYLDAMERIYDELGHPKAAEHFIASTLRHELSHSEQRRGGARTPKWTDEDALSKVTAGEAEAYQVQRWWVSNTTLLASQKEALKDQIRNNEAFSIELNAEREEKLRQLRKEKTARGVS